MRPLLAAFLLAGAGCSGFEAPTPELLRQLQLPSSRPEDPTRYRIHLSVDSPWLAGEFDGVVLARGGPSPTVRAQLFGDLGPKMLDLVARPDRITGFFPSTREGVDCSLPAESAPHLLLFLGVTLLEDLADLREDRVLGVREDGKGWWLNLKPVVPGVQCEARLALDGRTVERRFRWMHGLRWGERWEGRDACTITASGLVIKLLVQGREPLEIRPA
ncbi:MAG TPA: hypothetical protein VG457_05190, partial [Planctomycetota bacterium]|nr:hypothetical protein [Planctomycetota bacterium]